METVITWIVGSLLVIFLVAAAVTMFQKSELIDACVQDGHKQYECVGMFAGCR